HPVVYGLSHAAWALLRMGTEEALDTLLTFAQREPTRNRVFALDVLTYSKNPKVERFFIDVLHNITDMEGWGFAVGFFLKNGRLQFLEELEKEVPEPIAHAIYCYLQRYRESTASHSQNGN